MAAAFAVGALSVAGIPPAAGFVGKLEMFRAGIVVGNVALVVLLVVGSALSLVYMFQVYQRRFWRDDPSPPGPAAALSLRLLTAAVALARAGGRPVARAAAGGQRASRAGATPAGGMNGERRMTGAGR